MSTTLASLTADVLEITKRKDLATATALHVKNAILKVHTSDYYLKDLFETTFTFATPATVYQLDYKLLIPRFRTAKYLTVVDPISLDFVRKLNPIPIEKFMDGYGYLRQDSYYLAGNQLQIRVDDSAAVFGIGCYLYPDTTLASPSWIVDEFPFAVIYEAARTLFKSIGFDEQSSSMQMLVAEATAMVKQTGITTQGE
jgi:hypothetical protein